MTTTLPPAQIRFTNQHWKLIFEPPKVEQAAAIAAGISETITELKPHMPWSHDPQPIGAQQERLRSLIGEYWRGNDRTYTVFTNDGDFVLSTGLHGRVPLNPMGTEIGYWVRKKYQGKGLATLATQVLVLVSFNWFGFDRVQISHNTENGASRRVIEKVGFKYEGIIRNNEGPRTKNQLAGGMSPNRDARQYALVPGDLVDLAWVSDIRKGIEVVDYLGEHHSL